ncbi:hypothetical protein [Lysobacter enzymogenes]|uniref:hypothetical protein n=1 Tax=Lysobacter enzymogenes TaxID=69 RepID=UPI00089690EF|nr:hypothetical protein [Lysobacter enzymogenes]SDW94342.1 hypothetical protein SAMN05421681_103294 [Lysobacter enzymogenes]
MTSDELELQLLAWGRAYGERRGAEWDEDRSPTGDSPSARGLQFAPGTRENATRRLSSMSRGGFDRRALMHAFAAAGADGIAPLAPTWACDPVHFTETRQYHSAPPRYTPTFTAELEHVQSAWLALRRHDALPAECLRVQYQVRNLTRPEKAELVAETLSSSVGVKRFKDELSRARLWMLARLAP